MWNGLFKYAISINSIKSKNAQCPALFIILIVLSQRHLTNSFPYMQQFTGFCADLGWKMPGVESNVGPWKKSEWVNSPPKINEHQQEEQEELVSTNTDRPRGAASDANQEATWCERGQINATKRTVTRDRCFLNDTYHTSAYTHTDKYTLILAYYIRPVAHLLPQMCQRLSQTSSPRTCTHASSDRRVGAGRTSRPRRTEDRARTQTSLTTGRKL